MVHGYYVEVEPVITRYLNEKAIHFFYFCGGRGIGKTYGALDLCRKVGEGTYKFDKSKQVEKFLFLRRTGVEAELAASPKANPFKRYSSDEGIEIYPEFNSKLGFGDYYMRRPEQEPLHLGYCAALSTFSNLRGIDLSDVTLIVYDECIPETKNKKPLKDEGFLLLNVIETINRNRILSGEQEVVVVLLSNPIDLASDLLSQLALTPILNNLIMKRQDKYTDKERSLHIEKYTDLRVSADKKQSALYKFAGNTGFTESALSGDFLNNDLHRIKKVNLTEYSCEIAIENIYIYKHKSEDLWYISTVRNTPSQGYFKVYQREKFRTVFYWKYKLLIAENLVTFDNYATKAVFESMIKYKPF